ncbi:hypothetical protein AX774_g5006 [Zancudomyces culisetae]|uniref:Uncharacterized protein n=1 Tax=Zancudomyces culisetae TaxID=1213189 RepID=A0A1R1PKM7_ZANCU|nr:hypothetical protein AX774_g6039 [Zancudomyces culisetae]OMH81531.1 hypothetical protein AX774_g5006 [Zancudomyces culisetae]|eukprot:OMH80519.1 hypothetical protein AX774_g6039 [Zancudomyces culisetae]
MVKITIAGVSVACAMLAANATPVAQPVGQYANPVANAYENQQLAAAVAAAGIAGLPHGVQRSMLRNARVAELADRGLLGDLIGSIGSGILSTISSLFGGGSGGGLLGLLF